MFRSGEEVFLDDLTGQDVENALQVPVNIVKSSGHDFVEALLGIGSRSRTRTISESRNEGDYGNMSKPSPL